MRSQPPRATPSAAPPRAAIYARVSSDQQAERHTIDSQLSELTARASRDGHLVRDDRLFIDNGHSGASLVRPALERLRDLVALAAIDILYVHAPDRLARSYAHQVLLLEEFARAGTEVVFLNRPIGDTPEDSLLLQLQGMFAEYERAKVLERSRRGKRHRAQAGAVSVLSRAPFGYRYVTREAGGGDARYDIDDNAARVVRQIFAWVGHERLTLAAVCRRLHAAGIPSPSGKAHWSRAMIHTMLLNPAYAGRAIYGRRRCVPWQPPLHPPRGTRRPAEAALPPGPGIARPAHRRARAGDRGRGAVRECGGAARGEPAPQPGAPGWRALPAAWPARLPEVRVRLHGPPSQGAVALLPVLRHRSQPVPRPVPLRRPADRGRAARHGRLGRGLPAVERPGAGSGGVPTAPGRGTGRPAAARARRP
jgi:DNA invertase Pin-like site-specific DNA recombinase